MVRRFGSFVVASGLMVASLPPALATAAMPGPLPELAQATFQVAGAEAESAPATTLEPLRRCLAARGMIEAANPAYLVQVSQVRRPRAVMVVPAAEDLPTRPRPRRPGGKLADIAALALIDTRTGAVVFQAQAASKVRRGAQADPSPISALCSALAGGPAVPR